MFFQDKPGWGIALRVILVLLLIAGLAWALQAAFYKGYAVGAARTGPGGMMFLDEGYDMEFDRGEIFSGSFGERGGMFFHHTNSFRPYHGYAGGMGYPGGMGYSPHGSFGVGVFHVLFGILGFFLLAKLIFGLGGMGRFHRYGPMGWGPRGKGYHPGHYYHHSGGCPCCSGEEGEAEAPEEKPKKK